MNYDDTNVDDKCLDISRTFLNKSKKKINYSYYNKKTKKFLPSDSQDYHRIDSLRIPPAYTNVRICTNPESKIQAIGIDNKGRNQYIYNKCYKEQQKELKFKDLIHFGRKIKRIRKDIMALITNCNTLDKLMSKQYQIALIIFLEFLITKNWKDRGIH